MSNAPSRLKELYERYLSGHCSDAERKEFFSLLSVDGTEQEWHALIDASFDAEEMPHHMEEQRAETLFQRIKANAANEEALKEAGVIPVRSRPKLISLLTRKWWVAASILLIGMAGIWQFNRVASPAQVPQTAGLVEALPQQQDHSGAVLTLADGRKLVLDSLNKGLIAVQDGAEVQLNEQGLIYDKSGTVGPASYNTMTTPLGRQFRLQLPDGTAVMLNAGSSIRYPVHFQGKERLVYVDGEAWFDVKEDQSKPFRVKTGNLIVDVLGTSFNIRSYPEEPVAKTTLLSGKIRYTGNGQQKILSPGQQMMQFKNGSLKLLPAVDTSQVMAWKNGEFSFQHLTLEEAIREIARWYNLEPVYSGKTPGFEFYGSIGRNLTPQQVVRLLNNMGLHISLEEHKLIISP